MEFVFFWLLLSIVAGVIASNKGRNGFGYFILSILISPLLGIIIAVALGPNTEVLENKAIHSGKERKCPHCAELVKSEAKVCKHCGKDLPEAAPARSCPKCNAEVGMLAERCTNCAAEL